MERVSSFSGKNRGAGPRHAILDLAPLELECLSALWPMGEGTVRDIHRRLNVARPRAYTTVLTIMDRLAQKGIVARRKQGRAYWYQANLSAAEARGKAVEKIVAGFFDGSTEALAAHLSTHFAAGVSPQLTANISASGVSALVGDSFARPAARLAASGSVAPRERAAAGPLSEPPESPIVDASDAANDESSPRELRELDETLL